MNGGLIVDNGVLYRGYANILYLLESMLKCSSWLWFLFNGVALQFYFKIFLFYCENFYISC